MKKALLPLLAAMVMAVGFSSCQHQTMESMDVTIRGGDNGSYGDWTALANGQLICTVRWDALDEDVVDFGTVNAYYIEGNRQHILPYIIPVDCSTYDDNGNVLNELYVGENLRFDYNYGEITFTLQDLDNNLPTGNIPSMTIRVVAIGD